MGMEIDLAACYVQKTNTYIYMYTYTCVGICVSLRRELMVTKGKHKHKALTKEKAIGKEQLNRNNRI